MYIPFQVNRFQKKSFYLLFNTNIQNPVPRIFFSKIQRKSDPLHKIMRDCTYYSTQLASSFPPDRNLPGGNDLYHSCTSFEGASWRGKTIFTWFIGWILPQKIQGLPIIEHKSTKSRRMGGGGVGATGMVTKGINWRQSWNQIQTLKECLCCHIFCAQVGAPCSKIVGASLGQDCRSKRGW